MHIEVADTDIIVNDTRSLWKTNEGETTSLFSIRSKKGIYWRCIPKASERKVERNHVSTNAVVLNHLRWHSRRVVLMGTLVLIPRGGTDPITEPSTPAQISIIACVSLYLAMEISIDQ